jgi:hypothetical protein
MAAAPFKKEKTKKNARPQTKRLNTNLEQN